MPSPPRRFSIARAPDASGVAHVEGAELHHMRRVLRLAVDARHQGRGHGEFMLLDAFSRALRNEIASYAFVVDAKDDKAARFCRRCRFRYLAEGSQRLFVPMAEIAKLFS